MALMTQVGLEFIARNRANAQINAFNRSIQRIGRRMLAIAGVGGGIYAVKRGFDFITKAAMVQENAERELMAATQSSITEFKNYAAAMQRLTIYGDEQIISQMAYAANLGVTTNKLKEATTAAIGLAARFRIDLSSAMMLVGRASQGQTQLLTRYGIVIDQSLSAQEKFNELLKIGAESFNLAQEAAKTAQGTTTQFRNALSDLGETLGDKILPLMTDYIKLLKESVEIADKALKTEIPKPDIHDIREAQRMYKMIMGETQAWKERFVPGGFGGAVFRMPPKYPEVYKKILDDIVRKNAGLKTQSAVQQELIDNLDRLNMANIQLAKRPEILTGEAQEKAARTIRTKYLPVLQREIDITGRIGEAHWHAAKMVDFENAIKEQGLANTQYAINLTEQYRQKLKELEQAQRLARIADDIGRAFGNAFEDMIFEAKKFDEVMRQVIRSIARSVMQNLIFQPMGLAISGMLRAGITGLISGIGGGLPKTGTVSPQAGAALARYQYGGLAMQPQLALLAEREPEMILPLSKSGALGGQVVINLMYQGMPMGIDRYSQRIEEDKRIIDVWCNNVVRGGQAKQVMTEVINSVE
jgi:hypothetical protein